MRLKNILKAIFIIICATFCACKKSDFLNAKPNLNLNVPVALSDFQSLLDNDDIINQTPGLGDMSSDNYYYSYPDWQSQTIVPQNCYIWAKDIFEGTGNNFDWDISYQQVLVANVVLDGLGKMNTAGLDINTFNNIKGEALFIRANAFFNLAQLFAPPYDSATAKTDLGIPIRLSADVSNIDSRSSVDATYSQIVNDLTNAKKIITQLAPTANINRPVKASVYALLSRALMSMREYRAAGENADSSLQLYPTLIDYNTLNALSRVCFSRTNAETTFQSNQVSIYPLKGTSGIAQIDTVLYNSYDSTDLRKYVFYRINGLGKTVLKGTYNGSYALFSGLATNEMYLNRSECEARSGNVQTAMDDLNFLLSKRYLTGTYIPFSASTPTDAIALILKERRKELPFNSVRWSDLRRLNKEGAGIVLSRQLNNQSYTLAPKDNRYTLPIPPDEITISGIQQNPR